jgi:hypothetical protein
MAKEQSAKGNYPKRPPPKLHEVKPRELKGRDVIARFHSQFRGAALASLRILEGKTFDKVYCDFQDDFVVRETVGDDVLYHFVQVKTKAKKKHQWTRLELFGLPKKLPQTLKGFYGPGGGFPNAPTNEQLSRIRDSFVGKLIEHTVNFGDSCGTVTFLTNVHLDDDAEEVGEAIGIRNFGDRTVRYIADNFERIFDLAITPSMNEVHGCIARLTLSPGHDHLDPNHPDFDTKATKAVWQYSEINLSYTEGAELVKKLLALVEKKSSAKLVGELSAADLDSIAGVGIDDLLEILPISRGAYYRFLTQGDASALKNASILQRKLSEAGASDDLVEAASSWKVSWDNWYRTYRHTYELDIGMLQHDLNALYGRWARGEIPLRALHSEVGAVRSKFSSGPLGPGLSDEMLVGGVLAELVRSESR